MIIKYFPFGEKSIADIDSKSNVLSNLKSIKSYKTSFPSTTAY